MPGSWPFSLADLPAPELFLSTVLTSGGVSEGVETIAPRRTPTEGWFALVGWVDDIETTFADRGLTWMALLRESSPENR